MSGEQRQSEWYADGLRFTCTQCGNCCSGPSGFVWVSDIEQQRIADRLGLSRGEFRKQYAHKIFGRWTLNEREGPHGYDCVFLTRDAEGKAGCSIYEDRPTQCRTWPFWPENLKSPRTWQQASRRCPGMNAGNEGRGTFYPIEHIRIQRDVHR